MVAISLAAFPLAVATRAQQAEALEENQQKLALRHIYKVGDRLLLVSVVHLESPWLRKVRQDKDLLRTTTTSDVAVSVLAGAKPGEKVLRMAIRRVQHHVIKDGKETVIDSANPSGINPSNRFLRLKGRSFDAALENGKIREVTGVENLVEMEAKIWSKRERGIHEWNEALKAILLEPVAHLPHKTVAVGETWSVQRTMRHYGGYPLAHSLPYEMEDSTECELVRVEQTKQGRIAVIRISGKLGVFIKTGEARLNIDKEYLLAQRITLSRAKEVNLGGDKYRVTRIVAEVRFAEDAVGT